MSSNLPSNNNGSPMPKSWASKTAKGKRGLNTARQTINMKHGMFASIPIICKGAACPYFETCWIDPQDMEVGGRCPIEIAAILERFDKYCDALGINADTDIVDAGMVKEIVDIEIMMLRADGLLAKSGNMIEEVVAGVSPKGQEYYKPEMHLAVDLKDKLRDRKVKILNQLNATRKDKKEQDVLLNDPSSVAARIMAKAARLQLDDGESEIIDVTPVNETGDDTEEVK